MRDTKFNRAQVIRYLLWTFGLAYLIQFGAAYVYNNVNPLIGSLIISGMMFVPTLGAVLAGGKLRGIGWRLQIGRNWRPILIAWLAPAVLTAAGAALYFLVFPGHFDLSGGYLAASGGAEALAQMAAKGIPYSVYVLLAAVSSLTYGPMINTFFALGEEIGWRGFLYPQLEARFGQKAGRLLGGVVWGAWHWPLIWLIGYEYGAASGNRAGYFGAPVVGMLLFCVITVGLGILHDRLYEKSGSIWVPALFHGAVNAAGTIPLAICLTDTGSARLLGPAPMGLLAGAPMLIAAAAVFFRKSKD